MRIKIAIIGIILFALTGCKDFSPSPPIDPYTDSAESIPFFVAYLLITHNNSVYDFVDPSLHNEISRWLAATSRVTYCEEPSLFGSSLTLDSDPELPEFEFYIKGDMGLYCLEGITAYFATPFLFNNPKMKRIEDGNKYRWILMDWEAIEWDRTYPMGEYPPPNFLPPTPSPW